MQQVSVKLPLGSSVPLQGISSSSKAAKLKMQKIENLLRTSTQMAHTIRLENGTLRSVIQPNLNWFRRWRATETHILYHIQRHYLV